MNLVRQLFNLRPEILTKGEVGVEVEIEGENLPRAPKQWVSTHDGSLRGEGREYVLRVPLSKEDAFKALDSLERAYERNETISYQSIRESVHIHINVQDMEILHLFNFITLYLTLEEILVSYCGPSREGNLFCLRASDAKYLPRALKGLILSKNFRGFADDNFRYASMNISSIPKFGSLEFRAMRGTTDFSEIKTWIELLLLVKNKSFEYLNPTQIIQSVSEAEYETFVRGVLGEYFYLFKDKDVEGMARRGVRNAQIIAYATDWDNYIQSFQNNIFFGVGTKKLGLEDNLLDEVNIPVPQVNPRPARGLDRVEARGVNWGEVFANQMALAGGGGRRDRFEPEEEVENEG